MNKTYDVHVRRDGRWWFVEVPELDTAGQARSLREAEDVAKEVVGLYLDIPSEDVSVAITVDMPDDVRELWAEAKAREAVARDQETAAATLSRQAVKRLREYGFTLSDAGQAFGLSPQRIHQLAK